jgi:Streptomyces sporulation and cell division protein, SsgA
MSPVHAGAEAIQRDRGTRSAALTCLMTTPSGTFRMRARLIGQRSDPRAIAAAITDRSGVVQVWFIGRDLLQAGLDASASRPARRDRVWAWTSEGPAGRSLMVARASPSFEVLELDWTGVGAFLAEGRAEARTAAAVRR